MKPSHIPILAVLGGMGPRSEHTPRVQGAQVSACRALRELVEAEAA